MFELIEGLVPVITILIAIVAVIFLVSGIDDLLMDLLFLAWRINRRLVFRRKHRELTREDLFALEQKPIAMMVPLWDEAAVIRATLESALERIFYENYVIFVGVYPNDAKTKAAIAPLADARPDKVRVIELDHDGPTNKADCLNAVIEGIHRHEKETGTRFEIFVLDDAEDLVPRYGLMVFNYLVPRKDFVQLPVFPSKVRWNRFTAGHYMDEFAQLHIKDMRPREWLTGSIPSAGVGAAFSRKAFDLAREANKGDVFSESTLTEDYELPLHLARLKAKEAFVEPGHAISTRAGNDDSLYPLEDEYPYIRSDFPETLRAAVRQKSRWVLGISLQGWAHLGWSGRPTQTYMYWRDRKVLLGNLANFAGYILVFFTLAIWLVRWGLMDRADFPDVVPHSSAIWTILIINLYIMGIQLGVRFVCTLRIYGVLHAFLSIPRAVWGNLINFLATTRAISIYFRSRRRKGEPIPWEKTDHSAHTAR